MTKYIVITTQITIMPTGQTLNDERATRVALDDDGAGIFVTVEQDDGMVRIDPDEWPALREAIEQMMVTAGELDAAIDVQVARGSVAMSELMLAAVLSMPYGMVMENELSRMQFYDRAQQALAEIDRLTRERDEARAERDALRLAIDRHRRNVWGDLSVRYSDAVRHPEDSSLYAALAQIEQERSEQVKEDTK